MRTRIVRLSAGLMALMFIAGGVAHAGTRKIKRSMSGSSVQVPLDIDSDSCSTNANGVTTCTDTSSYVNFGGNSSTGGTFTAQAVAEYVPMAGTACNIAGAMVPGIASCTLAGSTEQGCQLQTVSTGQLEADRDSSSGDLLFPVAPITLCVDLSNPPTQNFSGSFSGTITGGTGKNTGATGTRVGTFHGRNLISDAAGNTFGWFEGSFVDTITTP